MRQLPEACPGSGMSPEEESTCPVCGFVWVNIKFRHTTPTHGLVTTDQENNVLEWHIKQGTDIV